MDSALIGGTINIRLLKKHLKMRQFKGVGCADVRNDGG